MKKTGLFPGSFDPFTKGHEAVVKQALTLFDEVIIGVGINSSKNYCFPLDKRIRHIESLFSANENVRVVSYKGLTVNFSKEIGSSFIIRGLRDAKDFEYERSIAHMNEMLSGIATIFFLTDQTYSAVNATIVREIFRNNGDISAFVTNSHLLV